MPNLNFLLKNRHLTMLLLRGSPKALSPGGYFLKEGPLGKINTHRWQVPTPVGEDIRTEGNFIEISQYFVDHCRMLVSSRHFELIQDIRYMSAWRMVHNLSDYKHEISTSYAIPFTFQKAEGKPSTAVVNGNCLLKKVTNVSEENFRRDLECRLRHVRL